MEEKSLTISQDKLLSEATEFVKGITLPQNYDYNSAVKGFYLQLLETQDANKKPALEVCTQNSIISALQTMLNYGLSIEKKQCALIVRGDKLTCQIEYFGWVKLAKTYANARINSACVRQGEKVSLSRREDGALIVKHKPKWECQSKPIVGAYAIATDIKTGNIINSDLMTMTDIETSWLQSQNKGLFVHKKFTHEMARKTVEIRLAKHLVNKSDDGGKFDDYDDYVILNADNDIDADELMPENEEFEDIEYTVSDNQELENFDNSASNEWFSINYGEYKDNKDKYIAGEYDRFHKTIKVKLKPIQEGSSNADNTNC